jgi:hypothetical protein
MKRETYHFWVGTFDKENDFFDFVGENPNYYEDEEDLEYKYISKFAESQGENWIDNDCMECGFQDSNLSLTERFQDYSYSDKWIPEIERRIQQNKIDKVNSIVFVAKRAIKKPINVIQENFSLIYLGEVEYEI